VQFENLDDSIKINSGLTRQRVPEQRIEEVKSISSHLTQNKKEVLFVLEIKPIEYSSTLKWSSKERVIKLFYQVALPMKVENGRFDNSHRFVLRPVFIRRTFQLRLATKTHDIFSSVNTCLTLGIDLQTIEVESELG
jgi:hypothetical protein